MILAVLDWITVQSSELTTVLAVVI